ncbi:MAG: PAS domain S-box protein [Moraxellaceae bacterium]|nr:PAS domain S-box protein [Moraxellaceae bacterium]
MNRSRQTRLSDRLSRLLWWLALVAALVLLAWTLPGVLEGEHGLSTLLGAVALAVGVLAVGSANALKREQLRTQLARKERDQLFSLSLDLMAVLDREGRFQRTNPAFHRVLGYPFDALVGTRLPDVVHPDDTAIAVGALRDLRSQRSASFELRCRCANGSYRWLSWNANPVPDDSLIYAVGHDVSDRKASEDALRAEMAFRKSMEESVLTGLRAFDLRGRILYVNPAFCEMVGWTADELIGMEPPYAYWPQDNLELHWRNLALVLSGNAPASGFDAPILHRDGHQMLMRFHISPLIDATGAQVGWMGAMHDVTEAREARAHLELAHERFVAVLDGLDAAVFVADAASDEVLYANRACLDEQHAASPALAAPRLASQLAVPQPERGDYMVDPRRLVDADLPRELFDGELQHTQSGRWFHLRERATRWVDGRVVRLAVATDITDRKEVEEVNREQEERLQRTSRLITMGEMASTLAHELNQPLSAIANYNMGCVNRLRAGGFRQEDLLSAMEKASAQAERAGKIVRRVRDFVRKSEPRRERADLADIVEDALGFAEIDARRLGVRLVNDIGTDLPAVHADRIMIEQVLLNLVKNAAEAVASFPPERRDVWVGAVVRDGQVEVSVTDYGPGIAPEDLERLFAAFFTTKAEGMGMGLNICRSIIEFHDGRLWVDPNPAGGSIFRFTLPQELTLESRAPHVPL